LTSEYSKDAEVSRIELMETAGGARQLLESYNTLDSLAKLSDSIVPFYFETLSFIQPRNIDGSIVRDTARVITTLDHEKSSMNEFIKQKYKLDELEYREVRSLTVRQIKAIKEVVEMYEAKGGMI
jgi:hypothetical protein